MSLAAPPSQPHPYAPPPRAPVSLIVQEAAIFSAQAPLTALLNAMPLPVLVLLNPQRQVVFANRVALELLGLPSATPIFGFRPGEVLDCQYAAASSQGCGTDPHCEMCGAVRAIFAAERGAAAVQECRITQAASGQALDLRVSATPVELAGRSFTILALTDVGHEHRRRTFERIFFHDLLNTLHGLTLHAELLCQEERHDARETGRDILRLARTAADEIRAHRDLLAAENGDLAVNLQPIDTMEVLRDISARYPADLAAGVPRRVAIAPDSAAITFACDRNLLLRVVGNMVANALEASPDGRAVTVGATGTAHHVEFWVHNHGHIRPDVQLQIFQRSFSTKGPGRGLGTWSMKLLTERYLRGTVTFSTHPEAGTTFRARYPRTHPI